MTDLRQKMLEDMRLRSLSDRTVDKYLGCASVFSRYHGASPADLGSKEVQPLGHTRFPCGQEEPGKGQLSKTI